MGAWIACEETVNGPDVGPDFTGVSNVPLQQPHGFLFEVPVDGVASGEPITRAGRFSHEAVALDPKHGVLYETEDDFQIPSGFFRYAPASNPMETGHLDNDGRLQMLAVKGQPNANLGAHQRRRATYDVEWIDIDDPAPTFPYTPGETAPTSNLDAISYVAGQGFAQGAAKFSRLEGSVYDDGIVYFTSTQGRRPARGIRERPGRLGQRRGPDLGVRHERRAPPARLRVAGPVDAGLPGQHDDEPPRDADPVRGQHRGQLRPRPDPRRPALRHRAQPPGEQQRAPPGSATSSPAPRSAPTADAVREHPGERAGSPTRLGPVGTRGV